VSTNKPLDGADVPDKFACAYRPVPKLFASPDGQTPSIECVRQTIDTAAIIHLENVGKAAASEGGKNRPI
jgi:hypothetical protein